MRYRRTAAIIFCFVLIIQSCVFARAAEEEKVLTVRRQNQENPQENTDCHKIVLLKQSVVSFQFIRFSDVNVQTAWQICVYNAKRQKIAFFSAGKEKREKLAIKLMPGTYYMEIVSGENLYYMDVKMD